MITLKSKGSHPFSRRDFIKISRQFGLTATLLAASVLPGPLTGDQLAKAAENEQNKRVKKTSSVRLNFAVPYENIEFEKIDPVGSAQFVRDIEERTDGEIRVHLLVGGHAICGQLDCVKRAMNGIVDIYSSTTQNASVTLPYFNVLDFPYLFPSRASQYHFLYHPLSESLLRRPLRDHYNIHFLFTNCHLRQVFMALPWKDKPDVTTVRQLDGLKIRTTPSHLGRLAMELLHMKTIPIPWKDTIGAMRRGMVDGMDAYESAAAGAMPDVISQVVKVNLFSGTWHTAMRLESFDRLRSGLQDAVMESAYQTQVFVQLATEAALFNTVGSTLPRKRHTVYEQNRTRIVTMKDSELQTAEQMCSPQFNPGPWEAWREKLNTLAGGDDVFKEIHTQARSLPGKTLVEDVSPRRWWKPAPGTTV